MGKNKIKRVMLMYPNQRWYKYDLTTTWNLSPYILCMLGTMIQDKYDIKIVDANKRRKTAEIMGVSLEELDKIRKSTRDNLVFDNACD